MRWRKSRRRRRRFPAVLLPLTVLWVSVTAPAGKSRRRRRSLPGAVAADGALGERHGAAGENPAAVAKSPVVLLPLTVLWSSVRIADVSERIAPPRPANRCRSSCRR